jgi:coniferyl-aldehyde dehydrogenase
MINDHHFQRMVGLVEDAKAKGATVIQALSTEGLRRDRRFPLTLVVDATPEMQCMKEEIFGPILPIMGYSDVDAVLAEIAGRDDPLSLFIFSRDDKQIRHIIDSSTSGGVTVNDVMANIYPDDLPFGGVGPSGMGRYHSEYGFREFSYAKGVYYQSEHQDEVAVIRAPFGEAQRKFFLEAMGGGDRL